MYRRKGQPLDVSHEVYGSTGLCKDGVRLLAFFCISALLKTMVRSWILSISLAYFPAWVIVAVIWAHRIFSASSVALIAIVHIITGLCLASWSIFVAVPFGKSPQLAAITSTVMVMIFAVFALVLGDLKSGAATIFTLAFPPSFYVFAIRAICGFENHQTPTDVLAQDPDNSLRLLPLLIVALVCQLVHTHTLLVD